MCKNNNSTVRRTVALTLALLFSSSIIFGQTHFTGFAGAAGTMGGNEDGKFQLTSDIIFTGHIDMNDRLHLRAGTTVHTTNLATPELLNTIPASFKLNELSLTLKLKCCHVTRYLALFAGEHESIGSDLFLQRQFGILPVSSRLSESWVGLRNSTIYPYSGLGLSYVLRLQTPQAFGAYFYMNEDNSIPQANIDLRFGGVFPILTVDFSLGFNFPIKIDNTNNVPSSSSGNSIGFHTGLSATIGNGHTASLFFQFGLSKIVLKPDENTKALNLSDLYFLIEPRFKAGFINFHFALFNIPDKLIDELFFLTNPLGCNLAIFAENLYANIFNFTVGAHLTISAYGATLDNFNDISTKNLSFKLSPFAETPLGRGDLLTRFTIDFMRFSEIHKSMKFTLGYKLRI